MYKILINLFNGNIRPSEIKPTKYPQQKFYQEEYRKLEKQLSSFLNEENVQLLNKLLEAKTAADSYQDVDAFVNGFRLGSLMMVDVFRDEDDLLENREQYLRQLIHRPYYGAEI